MKDGSLIKGRVINEGDTEILIETEDGSFTLPRSAYKGIDKNVFLRYMRQMM